MLKFVCRVKKKKKFRILKNFDDMGIFFVLKENV